MKDKVKSFFEMERRLKTITRAVLADKASAKSCQGLPLYLTEIYFRSIEISKIIAAIEKVDYKNFNKQEADILLTHLVNLRIEIYDEVVDWMKALRKPLKITIGETSKKLSQHKGDLRGGRPKTAKKRTS